MSQIIFKEKQGQISIRCLILSKTVLNQKGCMEGGRQAERSRSATLLLISGTAIPTRSTATPIPRRICSAASSPPTLWKA